MLTMDLAATGTPTASCCDASNAPYSPANDKTVQEPVLRRQAITSENGVNTLDLVCASPFQIFLK